MKLKKMANRRGFILSCDYDGQIIQPGGRYYMDEATRMVFCCVRCAQKDEAEMHQAGLPTFDPYDTVHEVVRP